MGMGKGVLSPDALDQQNSQANVEVVGCNAAERHDDGGSTQNKAKAEGADWYPLMTKVQTNNELLEDPASLRLR